MRTFFITLLLVASCVVPATASVEVALQGEPPVKIDEIYHRNALVYIAIDDLLSAVGLEGAWDDVEHVYRIRSPRGTAVISPGSRFLKIGEQFVPLDEKPRFIDNRLRVTEGFVLKQLPSLVAGRLFYRNLDPVAGESSGGDSALDRLFSFMVKKKRTGTAATLRAVAIDPGHGGADPGSIGIDGIKEKDVTLAVALDLRKIVKMQLGIPVYLSRDADYGLTLEQHLRPAGEADVDALLLLHAQAEVDPRPHGVYLYIRAEDDAEGRSESLRLASDLADALSGAGLIVRGVVEAPLLPLGHGDLPTVLVEMGYLTNPDERRMLAGQDGQQRLATALFSGLEKFAQSGKGKVQ